MPDNWASKTTGQGRPADRQPISTLSRQIGDHGRSIQRKESRLHESPAGQAREHWIAQVYDALGSTLYRHALMILADRALAEDAVQQAFIRLLGRGRTDDVVSMKAFLRVVVRNEAYRLLAAHRPAKPIEEADLRLLEAADTSAELREEQRRIESALRQLPPEQREVVHLKIYEQLSFIEIAQLLAISQNTAASRYRYAIAHLREFLTASRVPHER